MKAPQEKYSLNGEPNVTVVIPIEERYYRIPDGSVWTRGAHAYSFWQRYLTVFDRVRVVARILEVSELTARATRVDGYGVDCAPVPYYVGPLQFLKRAWAVRGAVRRSLEATDAVIMRVSGTLANLLEPTLTATKRPYGLEVIGDPYDVFAPGAVQNPLRPLFRWWFPYVLRRQCSRAAGVAYVTERTLQNSYPCRAYSVGMSDVVLNEDAIVGSSPVFTTHYSSVELGNDDTIQGARNIHDQRKRFEIVTIGSLEQPYKGVDVLITAIAKCIAAGRHIRLTIVGEGRYRPSLETLVNQLGINNSVRLTGQLTSSHEIRGVLDQSDLFILASRTEGLPRAMIEAMARGLPCIGTRVGGIPELLESNELVAPNDSDALASKIRETLSRPEHMTMLSARNLEKARGYRAELLDARRKRFFEHIRHVTEEWLWSVK
jgi:glycosyltransferase involved in cell wall biosynthesis